MHKIFLISVLAMLFPIFLKAQIQTDSCRIWEYSKPYEIISDTRIFDKYIISLGDNGFIEYADTSTSEGIQSLKLADNYESLNSISKNGMPAYICGNDGIVFCVNSIDDIQPRDLKNIHTNLIDVEVCGNIVFFSDNEKNIYSTTDFSSFKTFKAEAVINDIAYISGVIYLACDEGLAYFSNDNGETWIKSQLDEDHKKLMSISEYQDKILFSGKAIILCNSDLSGAQTVGPNFEENSIKSVSQLIWVGGTSVIGIVYNHFNSTFFSNLNLETDSIYTIFRKDNTKYTLFADSEGNGVLVLAGKMRYFNASYIETSISGYKDYYDLKDYDNITSQLYYADNDEFVVSYSEEKKNYSSIIRYNNSSQDTIIYLTEEGCSDIFPVCKRDASNTFIHDDSTICIFIDSSDAKGTIDYSKATRCFSSDAGKTWRVEQNEFGYHLFTKCNNVIAGVVSDTTYECSTDGGNTWFTMREPEDIEGSTFTIVPINSSTFLTTSYPNGKYLLTSDRGESWKEIQQEYLSTATLNNSIFLDDDHIVYDYLSPSLKIHKLYMTNSKLEFEEMQIFGSTLFTGRRINDDIVYLVGLSYIYLSKDNMQTFDSIAFNADYYYGYPNYINSTLNKSLEQFEVIHNNHLYRFKLDALLSVAYSEETEYQELKTFPNPAIDYIDISKSDIEFNIGMIVDINGKERAIVSDLNKSIDISNLESGVYFLIVVDNQGNPYRSKFIVER